jgi:hypothetical protein
LDEEDLEAIKDSDGWEDESDDNDNDHGEEKDPMKKKVKKKQLKTITSESSVRNNNHHNTGKQTKELNIDESINTPPGSTKQSVSSYSSLPSSSSLSSPAKYSVASSSLSSHHRLKSTARRTEITPKSKEVIVNHLLDDFDFDEDDQHSYQSAVGNHNKKAPKDGIAMRMESSQQQNSVTSKSSISASTNNKLSSKSSPQHSIKPMIRSIAVQRTTLPPKPRNSHTHSQKVSSIIQVQTIPFDLDSEQCQLNDEMKKNNRQDNQMEDEVVKELIDREVTERNIKSANNKKASTQITATTSGKLTLYKPQYVDLVNEESDELNTISQKRKLSAIKSSVQEDQNDDEIPKKSSRTIPLNSTKTEMIPGNNNKKNQKANNQTNGVTKGKLTLYKPQYT